ncbi:MAG: bifunctional folylpolyglutamate synthase/dihydrofolate synthase, partial [Alphaproteobacteria bacterium]|nr:bifunctional folylpolyglutamate synthase/dihydrofolate synthase [Alphaproteobacteria bacterium]
KVHVYTSPHLVRFNERIRLAAHLISDGELNAMLTACELANQGEPITFFEITTAAAFLAFSRNPADLVILETGLGGRLDATNVIENTRVTAITPVSLDHQQFLGDDVATIMDEKAGILRPGVPCIAANQPSRAAEKALKAKAKEIGAKLIWEGDDWFAQVMGSAPERSSTRGMAGAPRRAGNSRCRD